MRGFDQLLIVANYIVYILVTFVYVQDRQNVMDFLELCGSMQPFSGSEFM